MPQTSLLNFFNSRAPNAEEEFPRLPAIAPIAPITPTGPAGLKNISPRNVGTLLSPTGNSDNATSEIFEKLGNAHNAVTQEDALETTPASPSRVTGPITGDSDEAQIEEELPKSNCMSTIASRLSGFAPSCVLPSRPLRSEDTYVTGEDIEPDSENPYTIEQMSSSYLPQLKLLTTSLLPIRYSRDFYKETLSDPVVTSLTFVALYGAKPIGWIRCRLEPQPTPPLRDARAQILPQKQRQALYISVLALAAPHRGKGLATELLTCLFDSAMKSRHNILFAYAHVWEKNQEALNWYVKRGFKQQGCLSEYYRKLRPSGAWIVKKDLETP